MGENVIVKLEKINKRFGGIHALNNVSLDIFKGKVEAIIGENGAGKSTLMKVLAGIIFADSGTVIYDGNDISHCGIRKRQEIGIAMIHQEIVDFPNLSVAKNIFAGIEPRKRNGLVDEKKIINESKALIAEMETDLDVNAIVGTLSVAKRQLTMIAKALIYKAQLIIMDEPNSALTDEETINLFRIINKLKAKGIAIIYISHRLEEVMTIADRITVMRDGNYIKTLPRSEATMEEIIRLMVGREINNLFPPRKEKFTDQQPEVLLNIKNITYKNVIKDINFKLYKGEILGIAGLEGSGRTEMAEAIIGMINADCSIEIGEQPYIPRQPREALERGISYVPPERRNDSILPQLSVRSNLTISYLKMLKAGIFISNKKIDNLSRKYINRMKIKVASLEQPILDLSGGNQQKVVISRTLATNPSILIINEPTRGIDVGAKYEIYVLMHELAEQGLGIIFISSEMPEILGVSDRVITFCQGKISGEFAIQNANNELVLNAMMGGHAKLAVC